MLQNESRKATKLETTEEPMTSAYTSKEAQKFPQGLTVLDNQSTLQHIHTTCENGLRCEIPLQVL